METRYGSPIYILRWGPAHATSIWWYIRHLGHSLIHTIHHDERERSDHAFQNPACKRFRDPPGRWSYREESENRREHPFSGIKWTGLFRTQGQRYIHTKYLRDLSIVRTIELDSPSASGWPSRPTRSYTVSHKTRIHKNSAIPIQTARFLPCHWGEPHVTAASVLRVPRSSVNAFRTNPYTPNTHAVY